MRDGDLAESPLASTQHTPADDVDSTLDHLIEPLVIWARREASYPLTLRDAACMLAAIVPHIRTGLAAAIAIIRTGEGASEERDAAASAPPGAGTNATLAALYDRALDWIAENANQAARKRIALVRRRLLQAEPRSLHVIGAEFGVCRATMQSDDRKLRDLFPGVRIRADKPESARAGCRLRRLGARKEPIPSAIDSARSSLWKSLQRSLPQPH